MARISVLTLAACALATLSSAALAADDRGIQVTMNQAKIVKLARAADTVVIGEPKIADVAVQDATTVVLTGKGFGVTNLVILDSEGEPIVDEQVYVSRDQSAAIRIYRRSEVQSLSCSPYCETEFQNEAAAKSNQTIGTGTP